MSACTFCGSRGGSVDPIILLLRVHGTSAQPMEIHYSWPFHVRSSNAIDNDHLTDQICRQTLLFILFHIAPDCISGHCIYQICMVGIFMPKYRVVKNI